VSAGDAVRVDGRSLSLEDVERVARGGGVETRLPPGVRARMEESRAAVEEVAAGDRAVYGVNTGFGKLSDVRISRERRRRLQLNLVRSHACGVGEPLDEACTRALVLLRANVLAGGHSGVRPEVAELLLSLLDRGVVPVVPRAGSVGASGDLAPAAHVALVLVGEGKAVVEGRTLPGDRALREAGLEPLELRAKEGLALLNGTQGMTALGALALLRAEALLDVAELAGAMSLEGLRGTPEPFDEVVQRLRAHPGQEESARRLRGLLADSEIRESHRTGDPRVQDAYSLRCMPQVHGAARDTIGFVRRALEVEVNAATDNPLVVPDGEGTVRILSNGNFHGQPVAVALDHLATALASVAAISERRIDRLLNPDLSGLPAFLTSEPGLRSGMMMTQVTAASQVAEARHLATPASAGSLPTGAGKEDHVSMGMHAAEQAAGVVACLERVLAVELLAGAQAVEFLSPLAPGRGVAEGLSVVREAVPRLEEDRPLAPDIRTVVGLLRADRLRDVVERAAAAGRRTAG
jgi:histidine ammonia-lyase